MTVTGERVTTATGGFNPTWQRHVAAYAAAAAFLPPEGRVLDLGAGVGHSYDRLAPRETVGVDLDAEALRGQARETVVADMRDLPFPDRSFASLASIQSIEHVPDPGRALAEAGRVLEPDGVAVFITPNRLTFGPPDEIIDPYHYVEYDRHQLAAVVSGWFAEVEVHGLFGSARYLELVAEERRTLDVLLALDPLRVRRALPRAVAQRVYDWRLTRARVANGDPRPAAITADDFHVGDEDLDTCLDLIAVARRPLRHAPL